MIESPRYGLVGQSRPIEIAVRGKMLFVETVLLERRIARPAAFLTLRGNHIERVGIGDESVDPCRDDGQRYRAELEQGVGVVTTALPFKCGKGDTFKSWRVQFLKEQTYECEKIHSCW